MNERKIGRNERKIGRREFLRFSALAAAGLAAAACSTGGPEGAAQEGVPPSSRPPSTREPTKPPTNTPEPNFTPRPTETLQGIVSESTGRPTQEVTEVTVFPTPTPQTTKEIIPTPTWDSQKTDVSFLSEAGGESPLIAGKFVRAEIIEPLETNKLTASQKEQLNDALSKGKEWIRYLIENKYGDELRLYIVLAQKTNVCAAKVVKAGNYPEGTLFVEDEGNEGALLPIMPFSEGSKICALGNKEGNFRGWGLFDGEQLVARADQLTNRWVVGEESENYWSDKLKELGVDLSSVTFSQEKPAIAETVFYALLNIYGGNFKWDEVEKTGWQASSFARRESADVLLLYRGGKGERVFLRRWDKDWGKQFGIKDEFGNWIGAWVTWQLTDIPKGKINFKDGKLEVLGETGNYVFNLDSDNEKWEFTPFPPEVSVKEVPSVEGLEAVKKDGMVVYRAQKDNPYGLKEGAFAGYFYPEAYLLREVKKEGEEEAKFQEEKTGAVGFRPEVVRTLLYGAEYPDKVIFPIPFDINIPRAIFPPEEDLKEKIMNNPIKIMEVTEKPSYLGLGLPENKVLFLLLPSGSKLVNSFPKGGNGKLSVQITPQTDDRGDVGVTLGYKGDNIFAGGYVFNLLIPQPGQSKLLERKETSIPFGNYVLGDYSLPEKFNNNFMEYMGKFTQPLPEKANTRLLVLTLVEPLRYYAITCKDILKVGDAPVFILGKDNPLLGK